MVEYEDGSMLRLRARERPHVIQDPATREITHLINGAADPCLPGSCPLKTVGSALPANPFMARITAQGKCACVPPQRCDE